MGESICQKKSKTPKRNSEMKSESAETVQRGMGCHKEAEGHPQAHHGVVNSLQWGDVTIRVEPQGDTVKRTTEQTVNLQPVEADIATADRIFTELGGLHRRTTFHLVKESNRIRGREFDTHKFAGGLLRPYTSAHCEDLELFKAIHLSYLYEPSLDVAEVEDDALVICLSYRHKDFSSRTFDKDRMTDFDYQNWLTACRQLTQDGETVYFWQDQKAKDVASDNDLDWIATGVLPYIVTPVVILRSVLGKQSDEQRLWMSIKRHLGEANFGTIVVEDGTVVETLMQKLIDITASERSLSARIIHGFFEGKETYHEDDRLKMIRWAVDKLGTLSQESLATFGDISKEANKSRSELRQLYVRVLQNTSEVEGTQLSIRRRSSERFMTWEDVMPVFESQTGNVAGGISVKGPYNEDLWHSVYHIMGNEDLFYYLRFEIGNHRPCIMTGEVGGIPGCGSLHGRVVQGKKLFTYQLLDCFQRFAMRLAIFECKASSAEAIFFYLIQKHDLLKEVVRTVLRACWGVTGHDVQHVSSSLVQWSC